MIISCRWQNNNIQVICNRKPGKEIHFGNLILSFPVWSDQIINVC